MKLDESQQRAVDFQEGQVIVIAGAGSGKTRVLTERIGALVESGVKPQEILAFTFTNAAADEMKSRLLTKIGMEKAEMLNVGTMHSQMNKILRKNVMFWKPDMYGYKIMDDYGQRMLIKDTMKACDLPEDNKSNIANSMISIAHIKNSAMSLDEVLDGKADTLFRNLGVDKWFVDFFMTYEKMRRSTKQVGFDDMLWDTHFLLKEKVNILNDYATAFKFILVDEFQDTNPVQFEVIKMLQSKHENLFVVGDPRQCQPPDTKVMMADGTYKRIDQIVKCDKVVSYHRRYGMFLKDGIVADVGVRKYTGRMYSVAVTNRTSRCTDNHKWLVKWTNREKACWVTYLMRQGQRYRIGKTRLYIEPNRKDGTIFQLGIANRLRQEKADAVWILKTHDTEQGALAYEQIVAASYGLPEMVFKTGNGCRNYTQAVIDHVYSELFPQDIQAWRCLEEHGRKMEHPLWTRNTGKVGRKTVFEIHACNLISGFMAVPVPDGDVKGSRKEKGTRKANWQPITVTEEFYSGPVYSLDIAETHAYVADGISTLNSVYSFRQADVTLSLDFTKHFPKGEIIELEYNYRCASNIVEMTNDLIGHAGYPFMRTKFVREEGRIDFIGSFLDDNGEAEAIVEEIKQLNTDGVKYGDMVILNRTNAQSRPFEEKLVKSRIPYKALDGSFYESANVKDMMCYLELVVDDSITAFKRVYNRPNRFLGKVFFEQFEMKLEYKPDMLGVLRGGGYSKPYMNKSATSFSMDLMALRRNASGLSAGQAIGLIRKIFDYDDWIRKNEMDHQNRLEMLNELQTSADTFLNIKEYVTFIKGIIAAQNNDEEFDAVRIMTIHRSKGCEFPVVFSAGVSEGVLPHARAEDVDEERRLCYVSLTRAIDRLYVSYFLKRFNKTLAPSRFLAEMMLDQYSGKSFAPIEADAEMVELAA